MAKVGAADGAAIADTVEQLDIEVLERIQSQHRQVVAEVDEAVVDHLAEATLLQETVDERHLLGQPAYIVMAFYGS